MLDINFVRKNPEAVEQNAKNKGYDIDVKSILGLDEKAKRLRQQIDELRSRRNNIANATKGTKPSSELVEEGKELKQKLSTFEEELRSVDKLFMEDFKALPNMALDMVPVGLTEGDNLVIKTVGEKPVFDFEPKNHWQIASSKDWIDKERASKIAGARFAYLKGDLVRLEFALWQYGMDVLGDQTLLQSIIDDNHLSVSSKPFMPVLPPAVARTDVFQATGRLNKEEQTYKIEDEDLWLNASAEHTLSPMYMNEILFESDLPVRMVGYTTAFRREAGTYGKDAEGIFRMHQFNKLEMECFVTADSSMQEHLLMVAIEEYLLQQLGLSYQVIEKCTGDIGRPNAKGVDINVWLPAQAEYRESHSADHITDYQSRAMKTRVRRKDGGIELAHTCDATVFSERILIAIIENFQTIEGDVIIPDIIRKYMGARSKI